MSIKPGSLRERFLWDEWGQIPARLEHEAALLVRRTWLVARYRLLQCCDRDAGDAHLCTCADQLNRAIREKICA